MNALAESRMRMVLGTISTQSPSPVSSEREGGASSLRPSPVFWRSLLSLALILAASSFMNIAVFPLFDDICTYARDISVLMGALALAAMGVVAMFRPALFSARAMLVMGMMPLIVGAVCLVGGLELASPALLVTGACLVAMGRGVATVATGLSLSRMTLAQASLCIALAFVGEYLLTAIAWAMPSWAGVLCFLMFPPLALASTWRWAAPTLDEVSTGVAPAEYAVTQPRTLLPLGSQLFVCLFLFHLAFGFSLRFSGAEGSSLADMAGIVPVAIVALYVMSMRRQFSTDVVTRLSVLLVVAGFLVASLDVPLATTGSAILLVSGSTSFDMVAWLVLVAVAARNRFAAVTMFAWGHGVGALGAVAGAAFGVYASSAWEGDSVALSMAAGLVILVIVGYALLGLRAFSFAETVGSVVQPVSPSAMSDEGRRSSLGRAQDARAVEQRFDERCEKIADRYGLSPREREVFAMLARGRDRAYIEKQLTVSRNTVKSHVKHIYAKLDIHSHQDLIDLVEEDS